MTKIPKRRSPKTKNTKSLKIFLLVLFSSCLILPACLFIYRHYLLVRELFIFYPLNLLLSFYLIRKNNSRLGQLRLKAQDLQEKTNILAEEIRRQHKQTLGLQEKIRRYSSLKTIIEDVNRNLSLQAIADALSNIAFSLIAVGRGTCVVYLIDSRTQSLALFKTKKEDKGLIIKTKEGDAFDHWVLRHSSPLLVGDVKSDFRFDAEKLKAEETRPLRSLISAPLVSHHKLSGLLRLDSPLSLSYNQDDLRFLVALCDIGAVAVENGQLFERTQDLAIHDELTSLYTKGYFLERLSEEIKRDFRQSRGFCLLMLDIDHFKNYNDKFGHSAGDVVLAAISQNTSDNLKGSGAIISRFGGEEFCLILPATSKDVALEIAERLRRLIQNSKIILRRQPTAVTVSIGLAGYPDDAKDEGELILKADRAMYAAKEQGRNRVVSC